MSITTTFKVDRSGLVSPVPEPTNDGRCASCRHWLLKANEWGECALTEMEGGDPVNPETLAWAADGEDYRAGLVTHQSFGCVQYEAKGD